MKAMPSPSLTVYWTIFLYGFFSYFLNIKSGRGIVGALQCLTLTRPDLSYSVNYISQFMHAPTAAHLKLVHRILQCLKGTLSTGLHLTLNTSLTLSTFSDAD